MIYRQNNLSGATGKAYRYLFEEIVYNRMPPGAPLSEADIAAKLEISRTPVREAMMILEREGIVIRYPARGCFVAQITVQDVYEIFELRIQFEITAIRNAYTLIADKQLAELEEALLALTPESTPEAYFETDRKLHSLLLDYCGNGRLVDFICILNAQIERVRVISASRPDRLIESRREHLAIVEALRRRDVKRAEELLEIHIGHVRDSTLAVCRYMNSNVSHD